MIESLLESETKNCEAADSSEMTTTVFEWVLYGIEINRLHSVEKINGGF